MLFSRRAAKKVLNSVKDEEVELKRKKKLDSKVKCIVNSFCCQPNHVFQLLASYHMKMLIDVFTLSTINILFCRYYLSYHVIFYFS